MLNHSAIRLLRRLLGARPGPDGPYAGSVTALDGNTAVAATEAGIAESASFGASFPADAAELVWRSQQRRHGANLAGAPLSSLPAEGPRGALASAIGLAMSGVRASVFLSGPDLAAGRDLLQAAAGQRLPMVVHMAARAIAGPGQGLGTAHEAVHLASDSGCMLLVATNVQEAVDFALIARRTAELTLTPAVVVMDTDQTALSVQDVCLPPPGLIDGFLGTPEDRIPAPTSSQRLLFGDSRRRLPRRHDPDRPVLLGALEPPQTRALAQAAADVFFDAGLTACLKEAFDDFARQTGRTHSPVSHHRVEGASLILVAQGSAVETAELVADDLRRRHRVSVGVIGLRSLRPFPGLEIVRLLGNGARVCVLERLSTPTAGDPPLMRELRAILGRSLQKGRYADRGEPDLPSLDEDRRPRLLSVVYGLGGLSLRPGDLAALCLRRDIMDRRRVYLGMRFDPPPSRYPKRQVLLDRLRRAHPEIAGLGLVGNDSGSDPRPDGSLSLRLHRMAGGTGDGLASEAAALLHRLLGGSLRTQPALPAAPWGEPCTELIHLGPDGMGNPGNAVRFDVALAALDPEIPGVGLAAGVADGGGLVILSALSEEALWGRLEPGVRSAVKDRGCALYRIAQREDSDAQEEYLLGALCGTLIDLGRLETTPRRLLTLREELLEGADQSLRRLERFRAGLDSVQRIDPNTLAGRASPKTPSQEDEAPPLVRRLGRIDDGYDSLPRFWDQVGVLYRNADTEELGPDPYRAFATVPPLSAGFRDLSRQRATLPSWNPELCTGCGECWSGCPDTALSVALFSPRRLLEAGIKTAGADPLQPLASKLAAGMAKRYTEGSVPPADAAELIQTTYHGFSDKLPFPEDRRAAIADAVMTVSDAIGPVPLAATAPFFEEPRREGLDGELLSICLEPNTCKGCGICASVCPAGAFTTQPQSTRAMEQARRVSAAFGRLPETREETLNRARTHPEVGAAAAALLSGRATGSFCGGDGAEPGSGARLALRVTLGVTESRQAQAATDYLAAVRTSAEAIAGLVRDLLAEALPADDLDALAQLLDSTGSGTANLNDLIASAEEKAPNALDTRRLRRLVEMARRLHELGWRLASGRQGIGRAAAGVVLTDGDSASFPYNPFAVPVTLDATGDGAQLAAGLLEGQLRQSVSDLILLRRAALELTHPEDASRTGSELETLSWRDLTEEERKSCPALWLIGDAGSLAGRGQAQLASLLASDLPVKVLVLADLDLGLAAPPRTEARPAPVPDAGGELALTALSRRNAFVAQSAIGYGGHLAETLEQALDYPGSALVHLHAPSPARHGFDPSRTIERSRAAVTARVFPLFRYDPRRAGVFGSRIDLDGNPEPVQPSPEASEPVPPTLADWALGESRFAECFTPLDKEDPSHMPFGELLALSGSERAGKIPFVERDDDDREPRRLRVDARLLEAGQDRQEAWRMLQELAGLVTPFTDRVQREAEERVAARHQAELSDLASEYESRLQALRAELQEETRKGLRERLMQLAGYDRAQAGEGTEH